MTGLNYINGLLAGFTGGNIQLEQLISTLLAVMLITALICFIVSEITRNYSQVDKLWSLMPIAYSFITLSYFPSGRVWIMSLLVTAWGLRLSFNFARKGGYNIIPWLGEEDYRWKIMRNQPALSGRFRFGLFNLLFISLYQHLLILLFSAPLLMAAKNTDTPLNIIDFAAAFLMLSFLVVETISDNQLFRFHQMKKKILVPENGYSASLERGFMSDGLWKYVRHPNFACEQAIWICFYLFGVAASGRWLNWTMAGPALLVLLFIGSSELTERISSSKYPAYNDYKKAVPRLLPRFRK